MNSRHINRLLLPVILLTLLFTLAAYGESYIASTMRLLRFDGDVVIENPSGESRFVLENVRFSSGEAMRTGSGASASVALDDTKIVTLDENSRVEFKLESSRMELMLTEGTLFLDVSEKLDENEALDIRTSTMTVGIRGTIVVVSVLPEGEARSLYGLDAAQGPQSQEPVTVFSVLEGSASLTFADGSTATAKAGQLAVSGERSQIVEMATENVTPFIQEQFDDDTTLSRIITACPQLFEDYDFPADGDWAYTGKIRIIAQSASKLYDGTPLTRTGDILVYGLPEFFDITAHAAGSITDAGTAENPIGSYALFNSAGEDITAHFADIETVAGRLVVDPAPMTVWTGDAEKFFDGAPLTCEEAGFDLVSGHLREEPWRNLSLALSEETGEALYGLSGELLVHGTNPLTGETRQFILLAGEKLTVQLGKNSGEDSIRFEIETMSEEDIPEEVLRLYADNRDLLAQACEDTGWNEDRLLERIIALPPVTAPTTTKDGLTVSVGFSGALMRQLADARIHVDSDITDYSGRPLTGDEAHFTEIRIDDSVKVTSTGSQTEVGESSNTYEIDWGNENRNNFVISEDLGTLRVKQPYGNVVFTAWSESKIYDGAPLINERVSARGLPEGYKYTARVTGGQTDAGSSKNVIYDYTITDPDGRDVTADFSSVTLVKGTLTVEPAPLTVTTGSAEKAYDGTALTSAEASLSGLVSGESVSVTATGSITDVGTAENSYVIDWGSVNSANYALTEELGTLTVTKNASKITVT
ncbi:MAG: FecR domain-containing protein, partial [Clostridia bacterium]|nr:FecR domain-containing protein [Clostridia bacterium]